MSILDVEAVEPEQDRVVFFTSIDELLGFGEGVAEGEEGTFVEVDGVVSKSEERKEGLVAMTGGEDVAEMAGRYLKGKGEEEKKETTYRDRTSASNRMSRKREPQFDPVRAQSSAISS
jgi:hypothetical protein